VTSEREHLHLDNCPQALGLLADLLAHLAGKELGGLVARVVMSAWVE
jgi:hypothetical protein